MRIILSIERIAGIGSQARVHSSRRSAAPAAPRMLCRHALALATHTLLLEPPLSLRLLPLCLCGRAGGAGRCLQKRRYKPIALATDKSVHHLWQSCAARVAYVWGIEESCLACHRAQRRTRLIADGAHLP